MTIRKSILGFAFFFLLAQFCDPSSAQVIEITGVVGAVNGVIRPSYYLQILGSGFGQRAGSYVIAGSTSVYINDSEWRSFISWSDTRIGFNAPEDMENGSQTVVVVNADGSRSAPFGITVEGGEGPFIARVAPPRSMYQCKNREEDAVFLSRIISNMECSDDASVHQWARTLRHWRNYILNYFHHKTTNAYIEGAHNKIKMIKRMSFGFKNVDIYIRKMMLAFIPLAHLWTQNYHTIC